MRKIFENNRFWGMVLIVFLNLAVVLISYHFFVMLSHKRTGKKTALIDLDAQNRCVREADAFYKKFGCRNQESPELSEYRAHYSFKLSKCFIQIINGSPLCNRWNHIVEIFEVPSGKKVAAFVKILGNGRHYYDYPSVSCELSGDVCPSISEYENFIRSIMES